MGIVWESYHKGVPLLGVPGITLDVCLMMFLPYAHCSLLQVVLGCGLNGYLNTEPNRVFGALGIVHFESWCVGVGKNPTYSHLGKTKLSCFSCLQKSIKKVEPEKTQLKQIQVLVFVGFFWLEKTNVREKKETTLHHATSKVGPKLIVINGMTWVFNINNVLANGLSRRPSSSVMLIYKDLCRFSHLYPPKNHGNPWQKHAPSSKPDTTNCQIGGLPRESSAKIRLAISYLGTTVSQSLNIDEGRRSIKKMNPDVNARGAQQDPINIYIYHIYSNMHIIILYKKYNFKILQYMHYILYT